MPFKPACLTSGEIEAVLKRAGINATAQRIAICRFVLCEADHPSAETIKQWIDQNFPKMSLATVYNTLRVLVEGGLLRELKVPHVESVLYDNNLAEHYHFLDEHTGQLIDIEPGTVSLAPSLADGYHITSVEVLLRGTRA